MEFGDLLRVVIGAALGGIGTWIAQWRAETKRRRELLEAALLLWLDAHCALAQDVDEFAFSIRREPKTSAALNEISARLDQLQEATRSLASALHRVRMYERSPDRALLLSLQTELYELLLQAYQLIARHYRTHAGFTQLIAEAEALAPANAPRHDEDPHLNSALTDARAHLSSCTCGISDGSKMLADLAGKLRRDVPQIRKLTAARDS